MAQFGFNVQCERGISYSTNCNNVVILTSGLDNLHIHTIGTLGTNPQQGSSSQNPVLYDFVDNLTSLDGGALKIDEAK